MEQVVSSDPFNVCITSHSLPISILRCCILRHLILRVCRTHHYVLHLCHSTYACLGICDRYIPLGWLWHHNQQGKFTTSFPHIQISHIKGSESILCLTAINNWYRWTCWWAFGRHGILCPQTLPNNVAVVFIPCGLSEHRRRKHTIYPPHPLLATWSNWINYENQLWRIMRRIL